MTHAFQRLFTKGWPVLLMLALPPYSTAGDAASAPSATTKIKYLIVATNRRLYEYTGDGAGTIGHITSSADKLGRVSFTDCNNVTSKVNQTDLKASPAECPSTPADPTREGPWSVASNKLMPIYLASSASAETHVVFNAETIDLSSFVKASGVKLAAPAASAPIGFAFKDLDGKPSIAVYAKASEIAKANLPSRKF